MLSVIGLTVQLLTHSGGHAELELSPTREARHGVLLRTGRRHGSAAIFVVNDKGEVLLEVEAMSDPDAIKG
ncbi:hypothetical protein, partial [Bradyrhizobium sp. ORS 285]|uniref:hypothetical protein n=1 Tax=Bradyrhizobium sp. ORS 285 TaxID=115808 RepID=UPI001AEC4F55